MNIIKSNQRRPYFATVDAFLKERRAKLLKPRTIEERVTIDFYRKNPDGWIVLLDGANPASTIFNSEKDAEIYRLGLISKLRESEEKS